MSTGVKAVGITSVGMLVPPLVGLFVAPILALELGVEGRGHLAAASAPLQVLLSIAALGLPESLTFHVARGSLTPSRGFKLASLGCVSMAIIGFAAVWLLLPWLSGGAERLGHLILLGSAAVFPGLLVGVVRGIAMGLNLWGLVMAERLVGALAKLVAIATLAACGWLTVTSAVLTVVIASVIGAFVYFTIGWRSAMPVDAAARTDWGGLYSYGARVWAGSISGILVSRIDQLFMVPLSSAEQLGLYVVAVTLSEVPLVFNSAVREVVLPAQSRTQDLDALARATRISTSITALLAVGLGASSICFIKPLFGESFVPAITPLLILLVAVVLGNSGSIAGIGLSAAGRPGLRSWSLSVALGVNLLSMVILVPRLGAVGASIATLFANLVAATSNLLFVRRCLGARVRDFLGFRTDDLRFIHSKMSRVHFAFAKRE